MTNDPYADRILTEKGKRDYAEFLAQVEFEPANHYAVFIDDHSGNLYYFVGAGCDRKSATPALKAAYKGFASLLKDDEFTVALLLDGRHVSYVL